MRIGIFLPNWVGDVVMATPALRCLREHFGNLATLVGIMRPYVADVLAGSNWFDEQVERRQGNLLEKGRLVYELRRRELDTVLLFTNSFSTGALAWLSGSEQRVGFVRDGRRWLLTDRLYAPRKGKAFLPRSAIEHYLDVVGALGCRPSSRRPELATTDRDEKHADAVWRRFGWRHNERIVVLNTGGAYGAAKTWPTEHFAKLARWLAVERNVHVLIICGPAERESVAEICRQAAHSHVKSLAEQELSIGLSKACVRRSQLTVTTDSGPRHFAAAFGVPAVTLFGPTDPMWSCNFQHASIDLKLDMECGPCAKRVCPLKHHRCMRDLSVDQVAFAVTELLDGIDRDQAA